MLTISAHKLLEVTRAELVAGSLSAMGQGVAIDSREVAAGNIFFALAGERTDGHEYCRAALEAGARILVITRDDDWDDRVWEAAALRDVVIIRVADALDALHALAAWHRTRLHATVVGITGSTGKTTTKDFITSVLATGHTVVATRGNRNNELGVPLTLLSADGDADMLVVEMGMRGLGEIARLADLARPDMGVVTNVGTSHVELLGTQDAIAAAKGELVAAIPAQGRVFLNGDDAYSDVLAQQTEAPVVTYGLCERCDVRANEIALDDAGCASFDLVCPGVGPVRVTLGVPGRHNVYNALAAAAVGLACGLSCEQVRDGLTAAKVTAMRLEPFMSAAGVHVINDAYNANPSSMRAALDVLASVTASGRRVAVLGDMAELGSLSELAHFQIGEAVAVHGIDVLVTAGEKARRIADGALASGMSSDRVRPCATPDEASEVLDDLLEPGDLVLVKASRSMRLESVVEGIVNPRVG